MHLHYKFTVCGAQNHSEMKRMGPHNIQNVISNKSAFQFRRNSHNFQLRFQLFNTQCTNGIESHGLKLQKQWFWPRCWKNEMRKIHLADNKIREKFPYPGVFCNGGIQGQHKRLSFLLIFYMHISNGRWYIKFLMSQLF